MVIDYKNSIKKCMKRTGDRFECNGIMIGGQFLPNDMIKQLYDLVFNSPSSIKRNYCKEIPDEKEYEYYQWNGNPEDIGSVSFLKDLSDCFFVGCKEYKNYHLDYSGDNEIKDIYPGDYIINRENEIEIWRKEEFENKFIFR